MKALFLAVLTFSATLSFAQSPSISTLINIIPVGTYAGVLDNNKPCSVDVKVINGFYKTFAQVTATSDEQTAVKQIDSDSVFGSGRIGRQNVLFLQVTKIIDSNDDVNYSEDSIRIVHANNNQLNVSVENRLVENTNTQSSSVSCTIK